LGRGYQEAIRCRWERRKRREEQNKKGEGGRRRGLYM
jgi:hypothetical protein